MLLQVREGTVQGVQDRPEEGQDLQGPQVLPPRQALVQEVVQVHGVQEEGLRDEVQTREEEGVQEVLQEDLQEDPCDLRQDLLLLLRQVLPEAVLRQVHLQGQAREADRYHWQGEEAHQGYRRQAHYSQVSSSLDMPIFRIL